MAREITSFSPATEEPETQTEPKRPLMPYWLHEAAIEGNMSHLVHFLGLNNNQPLPHTNVFAEDGAPMELSQSDCLRSTTGMKNTILHILSANGHVDLVSTICEKDNSLLKVCNVRDETPFHHAARFGRISIISELIRRAKLAFGEDGLKELLRQKNCLGETALHEAATHGHGAVVSTLMDNDLELAGLVNDDLVSPLYLATARRSLDIVKNMVEKMLNFEITTEFYSGPRKQTALHAAVLQDQEIMASEITSSSLATKEPQAPELMTSDIASSIAPEEPETQTEPKRLLMPYRLHKAAIEGNMSDLVHFLGLNNNVINQPLPHTNVPVEDGAPMELSQSDCLRSTTGMKNTILHILSANDHVNLVSTICEKDNSLLKVCNVRNETPFHHAARFGRINIISELIRCAKSAFGEDGLKELLRQKNCLGETALHEAATHGHGAVVSTLMDNDLKLAGLVNNDLVSPLYLATARGSLDMVKNMVEKMLNYKITSEFYSGPREQTALHAAVLQDQELTQELLPLYSEPLGKKADETGRTPFHFVASTGNHKIAKLLLDKDPSLAYIQDSDESFPVHIAVRMGHVNLIVLLLQRCLDSGELLDGNGRNFLHIAIEAKKSNVIFKLLKHSKKELPIPYWKEIFNNMANTMDNKGNTPLHLAAEHNPTDVMLSLLENNKLDLALQNKESLTAFDLSVIRLRKYARITKENDILGEYYVQKRGDRSSTGWFQYYIKGPMSKSEQIRCTIKDHNSTTDARDAKKSSELIRCTIKDHNSTTDARDAKKSSELVLSKAQIVGLGSVLVATVTFAAAFTLPGDTNQVTGLSFPNKRLYSKACIIANYFAFVLSFLSTMLLIYSSSDEDSDRMDKFVAMSTTIFTIAARCMVWAMAFGLVVVLYPISKNTGGIVMVLSLLLTAVNNPFGVQLQMMVFTAGRKLLKHIPDGASGVKQKYTRTAKELLYNYSQMVLLPVAPLILIFVLAIF